MPGCPGSWLPPPCPISLGCRPSSPRHLHHPAHPAGFLLLSPRSPPPPCICSPASGGPIPPASLHLGPYQPATDMGGHRELQVVARVTACWLKTASAENLGPNSQDSAECMQTFFQRLLTFKFHFICGENRRQS